MELEQRVIELEHEVQTLKSEIQRTLVDIQTSLPAKPVSASRWQTKAWGMALTNLLLAVVLFTNIYLYVPSIAPFNVSQAILFWLRALWLGLAFVWLLLQLYPLALLFEQEDRQWQSVAWHNAATFLRTHPSYMVTLTLMVLLVSIINSVVPEAWLLVSFALLLAVVTIAARNILEFFHRPTRV